MKTVIKVQNLSKRYRIGSKEIQSETLVGQIAQAIRSPWDNLKRLRQLNRFGVEDNSVFWALKNVDFEVNEGEVLGIIGKNGAGKSTLLKILSGITDPTEGKIEIHGRVASLLEVGTGFHPELSGRENIYMNGTILGMSRLEIDSKLDEIIDFSGVEKFIDTPVKFYSSGMKVRLGFSVAAHLEPEILIIDEVLAVGDYEFQKKCLGKMEDVSKNQGRTVLFVSHNMAAVKSLCTSAIVLNHGERVFEGNQDKAIEYYLSNDAKNNKFNIENRVDRTGNGKIRLVKVSLFNENDKIIESVISGEFLRIRLDFKVFKQINLKFIVGLAFFDSNEMLKSMIVSDELGIDLNHCILNGFVNIDIPEFHLRGGNYFLRVVLSEGSTQKNDQLDNLDKAIELNVLSGDIYRVGRPNRAYECSILKCEIS